MAPPKFKKSRQDSASGIILGVVGFLLIAAIAIGGFYLNMNATPTEAETGCSVDGYSSITAVLIDITDPINPVKAAALRNTLLTIRNHIPKFGRLEIYPLRSTRDSAIKPLFSGCSPGNGADVDNSFYGNPTLADRVWRKLFADRVDAVINGIQRVTEAENSPLMEGIQSVAVTAFGSPAGQAATNKQLIVVSDMIQHTDGLSMYAKVPSFEHFKSSQYYAQIRPDLRGARVSVYLITRATHNDVQKPPLYKFWVDYIDAADGYLKDWEPLQ